MWMSVAQEHIPAATMNSVLIAKGPTSVTASLVFTGIQIRCDVKVHGNIVNVRIEGKILSYIRNEIIVRCKARNNLCNA